MHDIGTLIWVIVVVAAMISGIKKNVQRARETTGPAQPRRPAPPLLRASVSVPAAMSASVGIPPAAPPATLIAPPVAPPPIRPAAPRPAPVPDLFHAVGIQKPRSSGLLGGIFEDKRSVLRAVVAAEILGKPKALQEQSIWSPRHSEPSI